MTNFGLFAVSLLVLDFCLILDNYLSPEDWDASCKDDGKEVKGNVQ